MPSARDLTRRAAVAGMLAAVSAGVYGVAQQAGRPFRPSAQGRTSAEVSEAAADVAPDLAPTGSSRIRSPAQQPSPGPTQSPTQPPGPTGPFASARRPLELPRGGQRLLPAHRLVGYCGGPGSAAFGRLGVGDLDDRIRELERLGAAYRAGRTVLPVLELITVVAQPKPGRDGRYRVRIPPDVVRTYLDAARRHRAVLLLNVQPGRARFIDEVRALDSWLREPDVGLALDPEWAVGRGQVPGRVYGRTTGAEIDQVARYLSGLVAAGGLPEKALVVHQLAPQIVRGLSAVRARPGVVLIKSVDGIGPPAAKLATWRRLVADLPAPMRPGFKLFFGEDAEGPSRLMTPAEVLALRPVPDYVMYE